MKAGVRSAVDFYNRFAPKLAPSYESVSFEAVHGPMLHHLPRPPACILDVGAGSGRDALALARLGYQVTAVEPAAGLRKLGQAQSAAVHWVDDRLPKLASLQDGRTFDFVLCSAVLMSLPPVLIAESLRSMAQLLGRRGRMMISVRTPSETEALGILHDHPERVLTAAATAAGLKRIDFTQVTDALGRSHRWRVVVYQHA